MSALGRVRTHVSSPNAAVDPAAPLAPKKGRHRLPEWVESGRIAGSEARALEPARHLHRHDLRAKIVAG